MIFGLIDRLESFWESNESNSLNIIRLYNPFGLWNGTRLQTNMSRWTGYVMR